jgi:hypothetical protein
MAATSQLSGNARSTAARGSASERCRYLVIVAMLVAHQAPHQRRTMVEAFSPES